MFLLASLLMFIPRTKLFFQRLAQVVFVNNCFVAFVYFISGLLEKIGFFEKQLISNPSSFTSSDTWTGYMIVWIFLSWGFFLSKFGALRQDQTISDNPRFVLPAMTLAVASIAIQINAWQAICLFLGLGIGLWHYARLLQYDAKHKGMKARLRSMAAYTSAVACIITVLWAAITLVTSYISDDSLGNESLIPESNMEASLRMISERPLSGWGMESFQKVGSYFAEQDGSIVTLPESDFLSYLVQFGIVGLLLIAWTPLTQIMKYYLKRSRSSVTDYALLGILSATIFGLIAMPTAHYGYIYLWLIAMFSGIRWADIIREEALREEKYQRNVMDLTAAPFSKSKTSTT